MRETYRYFCVRTRGESGSNVSLLTGWQRVHPLTVRCVGTLRCSRSSSLSCRLQCLALSFFTPHRHHGGGGEDVYVVWKAHLAEKKTSNPSDPPSDLNHPHLHTRHHPLALFLFPPPLSPPIHPTFLSPSCPGPEGRDETVSGDVTLGYIGF